MAEKERPLDLHEKSRLGLVLGGGAALGLAHVGVIRVLEKEKIPIDVVVGCSMGALIGGLWVTGRNADDLEKIAKEFSQKTGMLKLFDPPVGRGLVLLGLAAVLWALGAVFLAALAVVLLSLLPLLPVSGVVNGRAISRWLSNKFGRATFSDTNIAFKAVAYDLSKRETVVLGEGLLADAVFKSIALSGIVPPVMGRGEMIVDGGVLNPLPVDVLKNMGVTKIIAVDVLQSSEDASECSEKSGSLIGRLLSPNIADVIVRTLQASQSVFAEASGRGADVLIRPDLRGIQWFELYKADELIRRGEAAARQHLGAIKALVGE